MRGRTRERLEFSQMLKGRVQKDPRTVGEKQAAHLVPGGNVIALITLPVLIVVS